MIFNGLQPVLIYMTKNFKLEFLTKFPIMINAQLWLNNLKFSFPKPVLGCGRREGGASVLWVDFPVLFIPPEILFHTAHARFAIKLTSIIFAWVAVDKPRTTISLNGQCSTVVALNSSDVKVLIPFAFFVKSWEKNMTVEIGACVIETLKSFSVKVAGVSQMTWAFDVVLHMRQG